MRHWMARTEMDRVPAAVAAAHLWDDGSQTTACGQHLREATLRAILIGDEWCEQCLAQDYLREKFRSEMGVALS